MDCPAKPTTSHWTSYMIALAVLVALGGHVLLTLIYLSPPNIAQEHLGGVAERYMKPLFHQNWHLFSPNPGISTRKLAVRCQSDEDQWSDWFDPTEALIAQHNANRFSGVGKLLYVYRAVGDDLRKHIEKRMTQCQKRRASALPEQDLEATLDAGLGALVTADSPAPATDCSPEALMDEIIDGPEFALAIRYSEHVCLGYGDEAGVETTGLQFKLLEFFPVKYADREAADASGRQWDKVHEIEFPIIAGE